MGRWVGGCSGWGVVVGGWWGNCSKKRQFVGNLKTQAIFVDIFSTTSLQCFNLKLVTWLRRCGECCHLSMCDMERNLIFWISVKKRGRLSPSTFTRTEFSTEISGLLGRARQEESRVGGNAREGNTASAPEHFPHGLQAVQWERMRGAISLLEFQQWPRIASKGATVSLTSV